MATPNISALPKFVTTPLNNIDWLNTITQLVNWLADGSADLSVRSVTLSALLNLPQYTGTAVPGITGMVEGSLIMNTTTHRPMFYDGQQWQTL